MGRFHLRFTRATNITAAVVAAGWIVMREIFTELLFGSSGEWLEQNTWLFGDFLGWQPYSTLVVTPVLIVVTLAVANIAIRRDGAVAFKLDGIKWVHQGAEDSTDPILEARCPKHDIRVLYADNESGGTRQLRPSDMIQQGSHFKNGAVWCPGGRRFGHALDITWMRLPFQHFVMRAQAELRKRLGED